MAPAPTVVSFAAPSGTGKTTLITKLVVELKARGHRVGAVKSDAHRVELDEPGKDTHRMRDAGAEVTALVSRDQVAVFRDVPGRDIPLAEVVRVFFSEQDFVLAEGFRSQGYPTIVVRRSGVAMTGWKWPSNLVALVSDAADEPRDALPVFALDDIARIADFVCGLLDHPPEEKP